MNPLVKKTVDKIAQHIELSEGEKMFIAVEVGNAIIDALMSSKINPDYNLKGGDSIDENTVGVNEYKYLDFKQIFPNYEAKLK